LSARDAVLRCLLFGHEQHYDLTAAVVMPDHVHCLLRPAPVGEGQWRDLAAVLKSLKGVSARQANGCLGARGRVWQDESWDRIVRSGKEYDARIEYIEQNPVRAGLAGSPDEYAWLVSRGRADEMRAVMAPPLPSSSSCP
jgi:REP element-mobilizing transposase RayT